VPHARNALQQRLRALRRLRGLTQAELAERAHLSEKHYQALETSVRANPKLETLHALAVALDVHPAALFADLEERGRGRPRLA
jgi:transcriptional regulator with XRE-family HTH domain